MGEDRIGEGKIKKILGIWEFESRRVEYAGRIVEIVVEVDEGKVHVRMRLRDMSVDPLYATRVRIESIVLAMEKMRVSDESRGEPSDPAADIEDAIIHLEAAQKLEIGDMLFAGGEKSVRWTDIPSQRERREAFLPGHPQESSVEEIHNRRGHSFQGAVN